MNPKIIAESVGKVIKELRTKYLRMRVQPLRPCAFAVIKESEAITSRAEARTLLVIGAEITNIIVSTGRNK
jgi:hypothetical protein